MACGYRTKNKPQRLGYQDSGPLGAAYERAEFVAQRGVMMKQWGRSNGDSTEDARRRLGPRRSIDQFLQLNESNWRAGQPGNDEGALGQASSHAFHLLAFTCESRRQKGVLRSGRQHAFVEHPRVGFYVRAPKVVLQRRGLRNG